MPQSPHDPLAHCNTAPRMNTLSGPCFTHLPGVQPTPARLPSASLSRLVRRLLSRLILLLVALHSPVFAQSTTAPTCAVEGGSCAVSQASVVLYGSDTRWLAKTTAAVQACSNLAFGGDPAPGVVKRCVVVPLKCASENGVCALAQSSVVIYGADARWNAKYFDAAQTVNCNNASFADPAPGAVKTCRVVPTAMMKKCGNNQACFSATAGEAGINAVSTTPSATAFRVSVGVASQPQCNAIACMTAPLAAVTLSDPTVVKGDPVVVGASVSNGTLTSTINWMFAELQIYKTPMCWRATYDRGIGIAPDNCGGKQQRGALCYDQCRSGYSDHGTLTCSTNCPSGYTDTGALCHYNGSASYSPVHWDNCKSRAPKWLGGGCVGGTVEDSCRSGYHKTASMCYLDVPAGMSGSALDPMKGTYNLSPSTPSCNSNRDLQAGLCYLPQRNGYTCNATVCGATCAAGTSTCGPGACASSKSSCVEGITNMVVSPLIVIAGVVTEEAASTAVAETKASIRAVKLANDMADTGGLALAIKGVADATENLMLIAESDIAKISTAEIGAAIAAKYGRGTPNYKAIARKWTQVYIAISAAELAQAFADVAIAATDVTGIVGTIQAFDLHVCGQHSTMP